MDKLLMLIDIIFGEGFFICIDQFIATSYRIWCKVSFRAFPVLQKSNEDFVSMEMKTL